MESQPKLNATVPDRARRAGVLLLASLSPALLMAQISNYLALPLDNLHIILIQLVALLTLWDFSFAQKPQLSCVTHKSSSLLEKVHESESIDPTYPTSELTASHNGLESDHQSVLGSAEPIYDDAQYPASLTYPLIGRFLKILRPSVLSVLPVAYRGQEADRGLEHWAPLLDESANDPLALRVEQSLDTKHLYKVVFELPYSPDTVFNFLGDSRNRQLWDTMCTGVRMLERVAPPPLATASTNRISVEYISLKAIWPMKARDMVILSHRIRLPSQDSTQPGQLICATTSVDHPDAKEGGGYARLRLGLAGYICELVQGASVIEPRTRVEQVTDLSGVASFAPASLVRMITTKMVPQGIGRMSEALARQQASNADTKPELSLLPLSISGTIRHVSNGVEDRKLISEASRVESVERTRSSSAKRETIDRDISRPQVPPSLWKSILPEFLHNSQGTLGITLGSSIGAALVWWGLSQWTRHRR